MYIKARITNEININNIIEFIVLFLSYMINPGRVCKVFNANIFFIKLKILSVFNAFILVLDLLLPLPLILFLPDDFNLLKILDLSMSLEYNFGKYKLSTIANEIITIV